MKKKIKEKYFFIKWKNKKKQNIEKNFNKKKYMNIIKISKININNLRNLEFKKKL